MTTARDRIVDGYDTRWDITSAVGASAVLFVADVLDSMQDGASVEVKRDQQAAKTGNVYLEYECFISGQWVPSGIAHTSAELFSIAIAPQVVITSSVSSVLAIARIYYSKPGHKRELPRGTHPTRGVIVPVDEYVRRLMKDPGLCRGFA